MPKQLKPHQRRDRNTRIHCGMERGSTPRPLLPDRHLFVTEGTKTEPYYLQGLIKRICASYSSGAARQFKICPEGTNTLFLLKKAEEHQHSDADGFQHIWIIYDQDDFPPDNFDNTQSRCAALSKRFREEGIDTTFHAIWSNQCIELWFLLHFELMQSDITRKGYRAKLSTHIGRHYEKRDDTLFEFLYPQLDTAIQNAKQLMASYDPSLPPSRRTPATNFYELLECLRPYFEPAKKPK